MFKVNSLIVQDFRGQIVSGCTKTTNERITSLLGHLVSWEQRLTPNRSIFVPQVRKFSTPFSLTKSKSFWWIDHYIPPFSHMAAGAQEWAPRIHVCPDIVYWIERLISSSQRQIIFRDFKGNQEGVEHEDELDYFKKSFRYAAQCGSTRDRIATEWGWFIDRRIRKVHKLTTVWYSASQSNGNFWTRIKVAELQAARLFHIWTSSAVAHWTVGFILITVN